MVPGVPSVTIAMPVYNGAATLSRAVSSALDQTFRDIELLVIDDGSSDNSVDLVRSFRDPRIRLIVHDGNRGLAATRDRLVDESAGNYIAWLDCDDWAHPKRVAKQFDRLTNRPSAVLCGTWVEFVTESNGSKGSRLLRRFIERDVTGSEDLRAKMIFRNMLRTSSVMSRTASIRANNLTFREEYAPAEDYQMWTQLNHFGEIVMVPENLARIYEYSAGASVQGAERQIVGARKTRLELLDNLGFNLSDAEVALHMFITERDGRQVPPDEYIAAAWWLDELQRRNNELLCFREDALRGACAERFASLLWRCCKEHPTYMSKLVAASPTSRSVPAWALRRCARVADHR
ncbi:glycosyltransferase family 2 protein [Polaromonas sp.]|uniref:glycosyltransferase family 2 protein n=1 Tax=Polaromonas sp. TaxID=1869339 RepID=UPI003566B8C7